jgi:nitrous oxidase accessory protein NosD
MFSDNGFDGFSIDNVTNAKITNNIASENGRHGINVCTGSDGVLISGNEIAANGFFRKDKLGNGITVQSNEDSSGLYITKNVVVTSNVISGSAKNGILLKQTESCFATSNKINATTSKNVCVAVKDTRTTLLELNSCEAGIKVEESGNLQFSYLVQESGNLRFDRPLQISFWPLYAFILCFEWIF